MSNLTWLQALLIVAHERRASIEDAAALLRSGEEFTTSSGIFSPWSTDMHNIADRLIAAGHDLKEAQLFAEFKAKSLQPGSRFTNFRWEPDNVSDPLNELFHEMNACDDADELADLAEYIADQQCQAA